MKWYFGNRAAFDWSSGSPLPLTDSKMNTPEGCASIADANGNLLFYTDGDTIWNKNHNVMSNGAGLMGNKSTTQSAIIVPQPGNPDIYYVFTADQMAMANGLRYSIVNMSGAGGLGVVTTKNILLLTPVGEKITAITHKNQCDIWIVTHKWNSDGFYAYLLTSAGLNTTPVISNVGTTHSGGAGGAIGSLKASLDGARIAIAIRDMHLVEIFNFDAATGIVFNPIQISGFSTPYGIEFSADNAVLYFSHSSFNIVQLNLLAGAQAAIQASAYSIVANHPFALQIGPDKKIYVALSNSLTLGIIQSPSSLGAACNYSDNGPGLGGKLSRLGLPNFVSYNYQIDISGSDSLCQNEVQTYSIKKLKCMSNVQWSTDAGGNISSYTDSSTSASFSTSGAHWLYITADALCGTEKDSIYIFVKNCGNVSVTVKNTNVSCPNGSDGTATVTPVGGTGPYTYSWSPTGGTDSIATGLGSGTYTVTVTDANNDKATQSITITSPPALTLTVPPQQSICLGDSIKLNASASGGTPAYSYAWNHGEKDSSATVKPLSDTEYILEVSDKNGCKIKDTVMVKVAPGISALAGPNTTLCIGDSVQLNASGGSNYSWSPAAGLNDPTIANPIAKPSVSTSYTVTVSSGSCAPATAVVNINVVPNITASISPDTVICEGEKVSLTASGGSSYLWSPAATLSDSLGATVTASPVTTTSYSVMVTSGSCAPATNSVTITVNPKPVTTISSSDTIQPGENLALLATGGSVYSWTPATGLDNANTANPLASPTITTTYTVIITDSNGCKATELVTIFVKNECDDAEPFLPNAFSPNNDGMNDNLELRTPNLECIVNYHLTIFNRWGEKVYDSTDPKEKWDGTFKSQPCNAAVFDYFLDIELTDGNIISRKGNVSLVR